MAQFQKFGLYSRVAEAELLALAGDVAEGGSEESGEDWEEEEVQLLPPPDLETEMAAGKVLPRPLPVSTPDPVERQRMMQAEFSYCHISTYQHQYSQYLEEAPTVNFSSLSQLPVNEYHCKPL